MNRSDVLHVVFGANGGLGQAVVRQLVAQGKRVRAVTRSGRQTTPAGVELVQADARDPAATRQASAGAGVIYHTVNVPYTHWQERLPPILENLIDAAAETGARLVYGDNLYMYGKVEGPLHERLPNQPAGKKGQLRARLADRLLAAHAEGRVQVAIGRASDFVGPGATNTITSLMVIEPMLNGKKAMWIGSLDAPHTISYTEDTARGLITLGEDERAPGEVWHIPAGEPLTARQFIELACEQAGVPPRFGVYGPPMMRLAGIFNPMAREELENIYQFEQPFVLDTRKFEAAFGPLEITPHPEAMRATIAWYRERRTK